MNNCFNSRLSNFRRVWWLVTASLIVLAIVLAAVAIVLVHEPSYHGKSLSQWLGAFNQLPPNQPAPQVEEAIRSIGPRALPYLMAYVWSTEPFQVSRARQWINKTLHRSYRSRIDLCAPSWRALTILGSAATPALPEIVKHAAEGPLQGRAMIALAVLGTNSIPALIGLCGHSNREVRVNAAFLLAKSSVNMRGLRSFMATSGFSGQPMLAYNIDQGLEDLDPLFQNLRHEQPTVRRATVEAIGSSDEMRRSAQGKLAECQQDPDPFVREAVTKILR